MKNRIIIRGVAALILAIGSAPPVAAQLDGIYKANGGGERWLHVREIDGEVFVLGEMQQNYWPCRRTGTTPGTTSTAASTGCVETGPSGTLPSTFVFVGGRRGAEAVGNYYFVPKGRDDASGQASFRHSTNNRGVQQLAVSGGGLAAATYTKMLNADGTPISDQPRSPAVTYDRQKNLLFAPVQEKEFAFSLSEDDLTDLWYLSDGTAIYLRQYGDTIAWLAEHHGHGTAIVGVGERSGNAIDMRWAGVPRSHQLTVRGSARFQVDNAAQIRHVSGSSFGDGVLHRRGSRRSVLLTDLYNDPGNIGRYYRAWAPGGDRRMTPTENPSGDREFAGNGPRIVVDVELRPVRNRVFADIDFTATEIGGDGSVGRGSWSFPVYTAPTGRTVERILSPTRQRIDFVSDDGAHPADNWTRSEAYHWETFPAGNLLASYAIIGDTRADDISTDEDPEDDTNIRSLSFHPALVQLSAIPDSVVPGSGSGGQQSASLPVPPVIETELNPGSGSPPLVPNENLTTRSTVCRDALQGRVAWNYEGATYWGESNLDLMCDGAPDSVEPARCFQFVMHGENGEGGVNYGSGTQWQWRNAAELCAGTRDAGATVTCFRRQIANGALWQDAIARCN